MIHIKANVCRLVGLWFALFAPKLWADVVLYVCMYCTCMYIHTWWLAWVWVWVWVWVWGMPLVGFGPVLALGKGGWVVTSANKILV